MILRSENSTGFCRTVLLGQTSVFKHIYIIWIFLNVSWASISWHEDNRFIIDDYQRFMISFYLQLLLIWIFYLTLIELKNNINSYGKIPCLPNSRSASGSWDIALWGTRQNHSLIYLASLWRAIKSLLLLITVLIKDWDLFTFLLLIWTFAISWNLFMGKEFIGVMTLSKSIVCGLMSVLKPDVGVSLFTKCKNSGWHWWS